MSANITSLSSSFKPDPKCGQWQDELKKLNSDKASAQKSFESLEDKFLNSLELDKQISRGKTIIESVSTIESRMEMDAAEIRSKTFDTRISDLGSKIDERCKGPPSSPPLTSPVRSRSDNKVQRKLPGFDFASLTPALAAKTLFAGIAIFGSYVLARKLRLPALRPISGIALALLAGAALFMKKSFTKNA